jgi:hypothetical protein
MTLRENKCAASGRTLGHSQPPRRARLAFGWDVASNLTKKLCSLLGGGALCAVSSQLTREWEHELDLLGAHASIDRLEAHLSRAPGEGDLIWYLRGYLAGARRVHRECRGTSVI